MKIYSWNMLFRNVQLDDALRWIEKLDFDVLCLQEVPEPFLEKLRSLPWHLAHALEGERHSANETIPAYVVIVSKHPIAAQGVIDLPEIPRPLRVDLFIRLMRPFHFCRFDNRHALYADISVPGKIEPVRVVSAHISLSFPEQRARELALVLAHLRPGQEAVVCGDFNIIESPRVSLLNWLMGGPFRGIMAWQTERDSVDALFAGHGLKNPLRNQITHQLSFSQLDHILVPASAAIRRASISIHARGSDHRPVFVEIVG